MTLVSRHWYLYRKVRGPLWIGILCCTTLLAAPARAINAGTTASSDATAAEPLIDTETLLRQVEDQVTKGQLLAPPDDNAFQTWERVLARVSSGAPEQLKALADFLVHARQKIQKDQAAGNISRSIELMLFADQAEQILGVDPSHSARSPEAIAETPQAVPPVTPFQPPDRPSRASDAASRPSNNPQQTPTTARLPPPAQSPPAQPPSAQLPSAQSPPPLVAAKPPITPPQPLDISPQDSISTAAARPVPRATPAQDPAAAAAYVTKGDALLTIKDISAARKFYEFGADTGSARAALSLAKTYDPAFMSKLGAVGLASNLALAQTWYQRAAELGEPSAQVALQRIKTDGAR